MYLRPEGATSEEVTAVNGGPYLNCLKQVEEQGHRISKTKVRNAQGRLVTQYKIELAA